MFSSNKYMIRKKVLTLLGSIFEIYDESGGVVMYAKQKAFKLKEEMMFYESKEMKQEIVSIKARNIFDLSATYDIKDATSEKILGSIRRRGLKSMLRDEWTILDENEKEIGVMLEDSMALAMLRRFLLSLIPQNYDYIINGERTADLKQQFNPFVYKMDVDILSDSVDKKVVLASAVVLSLIEGRQD